MSSTEEILEWTKFNFPVPLKITEEESSKSISMGYLILAGFFFVTLFFPIN